ncbi:MAG: hypothetical protein JSV79_08320 [Armatimonadota bacterium]|nr:MAG: hypothetical protein JSV79_08320 [Armatimonadota bacterium]
MDGTRETDRGPSGPPLWALGLLALSPTALCLLTYVLPLLPRPPAISYNAGALLMFAVAVLVLPAFVVYGGLGLGLLAWALARRLRRGSDRRARQCLRYGAALLVGTALPFLLPDIAARQLDRLDEHPTRHMLTRGSEIVSAVESFRAERGHYPAALADLVPEHLSALPTIGLLCYGEFKYELSTGDQEWRDRHFSSDPPYDLWVEGYLSSQLHYWPGEYPEEQSDGDVVIEYVDGWVEFINRD